MYEKLQLSDNNKKKKVEGSQFDVYCRLGCTF